MDIIPGTCGIIPKVFWSPQKKKKKSGKKKKI